MRQHDWYIHLGLGESVRTLGIPMRLTRRMAHLFTQAPHDFTPIKAFRWAQVRGLGGSKELASTTAATRLGQVMENEDFWETVVQFFINQRWLEMAQVRPIVDFLHEQKFAEREGVNLDGEFGPLPPPQPDFSLKGRTLSSLLRQIEDWRQKRDRELHHPTVTWKHSPINDFWCAEEGEEPRIWIISELLTNRALYAEGEKMRHCVAIYSEDCMRRRTSIWSMQVESKKGRRRVLTIEVDFANRRICEASRRFNDVPMDEERKVMMRWAEKEGLTLAEWLQQ